MQVSLSPGGGIVTDPGSRLRYALCYDLLETLLVTRVPTVLALVPGRVE